MQGTGQETRSFIYIDDLIDGVLRVMDRGEHLASTTIGSGVETTVESLAREIARCYGREIVVVPALCAPAARRGAALTLQNCALWASSRESSCGTGSIRPCAGMTTMRT